MFRGPPPPMGMYPPPPMPFGRPPPPGYGGAVYGAPFMPNAGRPPFPMQPPPGQSIPMPKPPDHPDFLHNKLSTAGLDNKVTTVWVGKISPVLEDDIVKKLLEACGPVNSWARVEANGQQKSFGFCYFSSAEGALRALRLLDGLLVGDENLKLKVDAKTEMYLQDYDIKRKDFEITEKAECDRLQRPLPLLPWSDREERDKRSKETIEKLIEPVNRALSGTGEGEGVISREMRNYREKQAKLEKEKRKREEELAQKRKDREEEERKIEEKRKERLERKYKEREKEWLEHEKERDTERKKVDNELKERIIKRKRDLFLDDDDKKSRRREIRTKDNRRRRLKEKEEDEIERQEEERLEAISRQEQQKVKEEEDKKMAEERAKQLEVEKQEQWQLRGGQNDGKKLEASSIGTVKFEALTEEQRKELQQQIKEEQKPARVTVNLAGAKRRTSELFTVDHNDEEEEMKDTNNNNNNNIDNNNTNLADSTAPPPLKKARLATLDAEIAKKARDEAVRAEAKSVISQIPTEQEALFAFKINWDLIDIKKLIEDKMRPWVVKKILEYLGEEEPTLIDYICKKLHEHAHPQEILAQLKHVLDDEASIFVIKMWRMLIYVMLMS